MTSGRERRRRRRSKDNINPKHTHLFSEKAQSDSSVFQSDMNLPPYDCGGFSGGYPGGYAPSAPPAGTPYDPRGVSVPGSGPMTGPYGSYNPGMMPPSQPGYQQPLPGAGYGGYPMAGTALSTVEILLHAS